MSEGTLYDKVWDRHKVTELPNGQDQLFIGLHLIHEVTSPQPFSELRERGIEVPYPERNVATVDHIVPTQSSGRERPLADASAEGMLAALERNTAEADIQFYGLDSEKQGITHVVAPELGLTQPGMTVVCGDSHTSTHGAFGTIAFGIGTSQVRDVLASQCVAADKADVRRIEVDGHLGPGVHSKDLILKIIAELGVDGGVGYVYEYGGEAVEALSMEERLAVCNMSIEGGARAGYINPDETTYEFLRGREFAPEGEAFEERKAYWESIASDDDADYDDVVHLDADDLEPMVTWGTCTNGRVSDFREAAAVLEGRTVADGVRALAVPGSQTVKSKLEAEGVDEVFREAGFDWREAGCSMCLAMNDDSLDGDERCASSSNRNYVGRQGSKDGRTILMSPAMVAAAAVEGQVSDVRDLAEVDA